MDGWMDGWDHYFAGEDAEGHYTTLVRKLM